MNRLLKTLLLAGLLFASQLQLVATSATTNRVNLLVSRMLLTNDPKKVGDYQQELEYRKTNATWNARYTRFKNWIRHNPIKAGLTLTALAGTACGLGYLAKWYFSAPAIQTASNLVTPNYQSADYLLQNMCPANAAYRNEIGQELFMQANTCALNATTEHGAHACVTAVQSYATDNALPQLATQANSSIVAAAAKRIHNGGVAALAGAQTACATPTLTVDDAQHCADAAINYAHTHELPALTIQARKLATTATANALDRTLSVTEACVLDSTTQEAAQKCTDGLRQIATKLQLTGATEKLNQIATAKTLLTNAQKALTTLPPQTSVEVAFNYLAEATKHAETHKLTTLHKEIQKLAQSLTITYTQKVHALLRSYSPTEWPLTFVKRVKEAAQNLTTYTQKYHINAPGLQELIREMTFAENSWIIRTQLALQNTAIGRMWNSVKDCVQAPRACIASLNQGVRAFMQ